MKLMNSEKLNVEKHALMVYSRIIQYLEKWYDYTSDSLNQQFSMFNLENALDKNNVFKFCKSKEIEINGDELFSEVVVLNNILPILNSNSVCTLSQTLSKFFTQTEAPNLLKIVAFIFAIPPTNAFVEHIFYDMKNVWTDERNRLSVGISCRNHDKF